jgi:hypothetical protein
MEERRHVQISLEQIVSIGLGRRWFSQGIRVRSTNERWGDVFIYVRRPKELIDLIEQHRMQASVRKAIEDKQT